MPPSLELFFERTSGGRSRKGPYGALRFEGEVLRETAGGPVIAKHENHEWVVDGARYTRMECQCRVDVHFERVDGQVSRTYGPYENLSFIDGVAFAEREIFAFADRSIVDWYCHADGRHWPLMMVRPAP